MLAGKYTEVLLNTVPAETISNPACPRNGRCGGDSQYGFRQFLTCTAETVNPSGSVGKDNSSISIKK